MRNNFKLAKHDLTLVHIACLFLLQSTPNGNWRLRRDRRIYDIEEKGTGGGRTIDLVLILIDHDHKFHISIADVYFSCLCPISLELNEKTISIVSVTGKAQYKYINRTMIIDNFRSERNVPIHSFIKKYIFCLLRVNFSV